MLTVPTDQKWEASQLIVMHTKEFLDEDTPLQAQCKGSFRNYVTQLGGGALYFCDNV